MVFALFISLSAPLRGTSGYAIVDAVVRLGPAFFFVYIVTRVGLLAILARFVGFGILRTYPMTRDLDSWWTGATLFGWGVLLVMTLGAAWTASEGRILGGEPKKE